MKKIWDYLKPRLWVMEQIGLYWLICCLPVITIGPATAAAYYTTMKVLRRESGDLRESFFHSFRDNLKQGIFLTIICLAIYGMLGINILSHWTDTSTLGILLKVACFFLIILFTGMAHYLFPALSRFRLSNGKLLVMSLQMSIRFLLSTFILDCYLVAMIYSLSQWPWIALFVPGLWMFLISLSVEKALKLYMPAPEDGTDDEDQWYHQ